MADGSPTPALGERYRLGAELGKGGMSTVYRAVDLETDREVAVKVYAAGGSVDARTRQHREVTLGAGLSHDGIVPILDHGDTYLVTELVEGSTLRDRMASGPCSVDEVAQFGARLASALGYLHEHGIVHRDVKPANVLLGRNGDLSGAKLADFGVAIRLDDSRVTIDGCVVGTAAYLSPEQVSGGALTPASDIYSLGLVLIELLTGVASYEGSGAECALARLNRQPVIPPQAPPWLATLLTAMTALDPKARPAAFDVELAFGLARAPAATAVLDLGEVAPLTALAFASPEAATGVLDVGARNPRRLAMAPWRLASLVGLAAAVVMLAAAALSGGDVASVRPPVTTPTRAAVAPSSVPKVAVQVAPSTTSSVVVAKPTVTPPAQHDGKRKGHGHGGD